MILPGGLKEGRRYLIGIAASRSSFALMGTSPIGAGAHSQSTTSTGTAHPSAQQGSLPSWPW